MCLTPNLHRLQSGIIIAFQRGNCEAAREVTKGMMYEAGPADDWRAGDAEISLIKKPPAICQAKSERQEVCLCRELIGYQQTSLAQQSLALLQRLAHVAGSV